MSLFSKLDQYLINDIYTLAYKFQYNDVINKLNDSLYRWYNFNNVFCSSDSEYICSENEYIDHLKFYLEFMHKGFSHAL